MFRTIRTFALCAAFATTAHAQFSGPALNWVGSSGTSAGTFNPACTNHTVDITRGESILLRVWGDHQAPYAIALSPTSTACTPIPGIVGGLMLGAPAITVSAGMTSTLVPCLACPESYHDVNFVVPAGTPLGLSVTFQAVGVGWGNIGLTESITGTVAF